MQKQQCNMENKFSTHDAFHGASFFEDALYTRQQPTLNLTSALWSRNLSLCSHLSDCHTQNINVHPHYMLTQLHPLNIFL